MADQSLKATIQVDMDNRGLVKGVTDTQKQLESLNKTSARTARAAGISAAINVAETGISVVRAAASAIDKRVQQLTDITTRFSVQAQNAKIDAEMAREDSMRRIASALEPGAAQVLRAGVDVAGGEAARIERNQGMISAGMGATARAGENYMAQLNILAEAGAGFLAGIEQAAGGMGVFTAEGRAGFGQMAGAAGSLFSELGNAQNFAYAPQGSARGMPYDDRSMMERQTTALENIERKIGGQ